jgi:hypothetical protein
MRAKQMKAGAAWRDSTNVCAFSDHERHLGHIVRACEGWLAFDATHANEQGSWFRLLGYFPAITMAKEAVQLATLSLQQAGPTAWGKFSEQQAG